MFSVSTRLETSFTKTINSILNIFPQTISIENLLSTKIVELLKLHKIRLIFHLLYTFPLPFHGFFLNVLHRREAVHSEEKQKVKQSDD